MFWDKLKDILLDFTNVFYPDVCLSCGETLKYGEKYLCTNCLFSLPQTHFVSTKQNIVYDHLVGLIFSLENAYSFCFYQKTSKMQKILHAIKYSGQRELARFLGAYCSPVLLDTDFKNIDVIIPVPLHPLKQKKRGYNQSEWLAMGIADVINKPIDTKSIVRTVFTQTQTKKSKEERWKNVQKIFDLVKPELLENKHILLVDDVITTGATIISLANTIETKIKNVKISVLSLATASNFI